MKIVIIGGTGLIGSKLAKKLRKLDHEVIAASPSSGVNTITGEGLNEVLKGAQVVVDVSNSPSFEEKAVLEFFQTSTRNLLAAEAAGGVQHHVALSIVGVERPPGNPYFRAKLAQEKLIKESGLPYSILHSTQFFEFSASIAQIGTVGEEVHISTGLFQPVASDDVVEALANITIGEPINGTIEIGGPERSGMDDFIGRFLKWTKDSRQLVSDEHALYFGGEVTDQLVPGNNPIIGKLKYEDWFATQYVKM
jgi:uncharacterized protein YbjT (DUF2867 family)